MVWSVEAYVDARGSVPVEDFYLENGRPKRIAGRGISVNQDWARLRRIINDHIEPQQGALRPYREAFHKVEEFWQIRTGQIRVLCVVDRTRADVLLMLHAFKKKQQKTPKTDLQIARNLVEKLKV